MARVHNIVIVSMQAAKNTPLRSEPIEILAVT
jgi:hypothetical protein